MRIYELTSISPGYSLKYMFNYINYYYNLRISFRHGNKHRKFLRIINLIIIWTSIEVLHYHIQIHKWHECILRVYGNMFGVKLSDKHPAPHFERRHSIKQIKLIGFVEITHALIYICSYNVSTTIYTIYWILYKLNNNIANTYIVRY